MKCAIEDLEKHYGSFFDNSGYDATCRMILPHELAGLTVLDVACRRGKGVYKCTDRVGAAGRAIGIDWRPDMLDRARSGEWHACRKNDLAVSNMQFIQAYPEQIADVLEAQSVDVAYVNSVMNLFYDPCAALAAIHDVLKPQGLLVCETVIASAPRDMDVVAAARANGNSVQAAVDADALLTWFADAGFSLGTIQARTMNAVHPAANCEGELTAPLAPSSERVEFAAIHIQVRA